MTEAEWLACSDPRALLNWLQQASIKRSPEDISLPCPSDRKLRLALCACCRRVWGSLGPMGRAAVECAEFVADAVLSAKELSHYSQMAGAEAGQADRFTAGNQACMAAAWVAQDHLDHPDQVLRSAATGAAYAATPYDHLMEEINEAGSDGPRPLNVRHVTVYDAECAAQAALLREVFGDPFRPVAFAWAGLMLCDPPARALSGMARRIYEESDWSALPVLADALEEAGCTEEALLAHLRGPGPHVRGCWALDLLLGKG